MTRPVLSTPTLLTVFLAAATPLNVLALAARPGHDALRLALIVLTLLPLTWCGAVLWRSRGRDGPPLKPFYLAVLALPVVQVLGRVALNLANGQPLRGLDAAALAVGALALLALPFVPLKR